MPLSASRLRILVASLLAVSFLGALDHTIVSTSLATIAGEVGALEAMSWVVVGYTLAATVLLPVIGALGDALGPRRVFLVSLALFVVASLACGFAQDMVQLVAARVVQGTSSAGLQLMSQTIVAHVTTPRERPRQLAVIGAAFPVAILVGPLLGGAITEYWGWPWVFWINAPVGLAALAFASVAIPHIDPGSRRGLDVPGSVAFTVAMIALVLGVTWFPDPRLTAAAWACLGFAVVGMAAFAMIELRSPAPLIPLRLFRMRAVSASVALSAVIGIGLFSVVSYLPTFFQMAARTSVTVSGLVPIATVFGMLVSNLATGWLVARTGRYRAYPVMGTALGAAGLLTMAVLPVGLPLWVPALAMFVVGVGTGAFMNLIIAVAQGSVARDRMGSVTAVVNLTRQVGATTGTAVIGGVIAAGVAAGLGGSFDTSTLTPQLVHAAPAAVQAEVAAVYQAAFAPVFAALACVYAAGVVAALFLPATRLGDDAPAPLPADDAPVAA
ncbi:MFS transporter [Microbacterium karelineae]|uniref:MFS transporter n=1 Tax=Microbacterium karelineae TaxID=2654283 RepID=UPI0012E99447|nr:MFS transporter [Microbacterium karelineae]